jgi:hypothetical protein
MNALFGAVIKVFLTLVQANDTMSKDDGNSPNNWHCCGSVVLGHSASPYCLQ